MEEKDLQIERLQSLNHQLRQENEQQAKRIAQYVAQCTELLDRNFALSQENSKLQHKLTLLLDVSLFARK
jgi:hypothetical protein